MKLRASSLIALLTCLLTAAVCSHPAAQWRLELLRMKASGDLGGVAWADLLSRMATVDAESNGGRWVMGSVRLTAVGDGPCPAQFESPLGPFRGYLVDEWDLEHFVNNYLGLNADARLGLGPHVEPGDTVVELGPWLGTFVRFALNHGAAKVIAIEPIPQIVECFRQTFAAELADGRVELIEAAAWSRSGKVRMALQGQNNDRNSNEGYHVSPEGDLSVEAIRLDAVLRELGVERVDLINMDIEGAERHALAGAAETIRRDLPQIVACVHHLDDDQTAIFSLMREIAPSYEVLTDNYHARFVADHRPSDANAQRK